MGRLPVALEVILPGALAGVFGESFGLKDLLEGLDHVRMPAEIDIRVIWLGMLAPSLGEFSAGPDGLDEAAAPGQLPGSSCGSLMMGK